MINNFIKLLKAFIILNFIINILKPSSIYGVEEKFNNIGFETDLSYWTTDDGAWWNAGGAECALLAYQPLGALDYESSKINLVNPGTYNAKEGVAPALQTYGWQFNGINQYLNTDFLPANDGKQSMIVQFSDYLDNTKIKMIGMDDGLGGSAFYIFGPNTDYKPAFANGSSSSGSIIGPVTKGNLALAGKYGYWNGIKDPVVYFFPWGNNATRPVNIGRENFWAPEYSAVTIQAFAIFNCTLTSRQIRYIAKAMENLTGAKTIRDTLIKYSGLASAKVSTVNNFNFVQSVNVGDINKYNLIAYVYANGNKVSNLDAELFYNHSTIPTTYTYIKNGWYQLKSKLIGANELRNYGVQIKSGKQLYLDDLSLIQRSP